MPENPLCQIGSSSAATRTVRLSEKAWVRMVHSGAQREQAAKMPASESYLCPQGE